MLRSEGRISYEPHLRTNEIFKVINRRNIQLVEKLWKEGADINERRDISSNLHNASMRGCRKIVEFLLKHGANVDARDETLETSLHMAVSQRYFEIAECS